MRLVHLFIPLLITSLAAASTSCKKTASALITLDPIQEAPLTPNLETDDSTAGVKYIVRASSQAKITERQWQGIPTIASTTDGKFMVTAFYTGGKGEGPGNFITISLSTNYGASWQSDQLVVYPLKPDADRLFDPCLWRDPQDNIWLFWAKSTGWWDGRAGVWAVKLNIAKKGISYNKAVRLSDGIMLNKPIQLSEKQKFLFPVALWGLNPVDKAKTGVFACENISAGTTFKLDSIKKVGSVAVPPPIRIFDEHQFVETSKPGKLLCYIRTVKGVYYSTSQDYGKTWSEVEPLNLPGGTTSARFNITKLKSGNLMLVLNNSTTTRTNMKAYISKNDGADWGNGLLLDARTNVSYPDVELTTNGDIHVVYDRDRSGAKQILYCRFTEQDIVTGDTGKIFRSKISGE